MRWILKLEARLCLTEPGGQLVVRYYRDDVSDDVSESCQGLNQPGEEG